MIVPEWFPSKKPWIIGDGIKGMRQLPDKCAGVLYTDPVWPNCKAEIEGKGRAEEIFQEAAIEMVRITDRICIHLGCDTDPRMLNYISRELPFIRVIWLRYAQPSYKGRIVYSGDVAYLFGIPPKSRPGNKVISGEHCSVATDGRNRKDHPCPRKYDHVEWLIQKISNPGEIVVDPFLGSGTTLRACRKTGRDGVGWEINSEYEEAIRTSVMDEIKPIETYF